MRQSVSMLRLFAAVAAMLVHVNAFSAAQITGVTPASVRAPLGQSLTVNLTWRVATGAPPATLFSTYGEFRLGTVNGIVLATVNKPLSRSAPTSTPVVFTETLTVPRSVIYSAFKVVSGSGGMGPARIVYVRAFDDGDLLDTGVIVNVAIDVTSPASAGFNISRLALRFEDDAIDKVVKQDQFLRAKVSITYSGSGVVRGVWEVADPSSTSGTPIYRPLTQVREFVSTRGDKTLLSPRLPTSRAGLHRLRFRLIDPTLSDSEPTVRYFVQTNPMPSEPITLLAPVHLALLGKETRFVWQPVAGTRAYKLELFEQELPVALPSDIDSVEAPRSIDPRPGAAISPSAGLMVPGDQTAVPLSLITRTRLQSGRSYLWRVVAIGPEGTVIGESPLQAVRVP